MIELNVWQLRGETNSPTRNRPPRKRLVNLPVRNPTPSICSTHRHAGLTEFLSSDWIFWVQQLDARLIGIPRRQLRQKPAIQLHYCNILITPMFFRVDRRPNRTQMAGDDCLDLRCGFGLAFSQQSTAARLITFGGLLAVSNILLSYSYHAYQSEVYPTRVRARAIGFVYSFKPPLHCVQQLHDRVLPAKIWNRRRVFFYRIRDVNRRARGRLLGPAPAGRPWRTLRNNFKHVWLAKQ